MAKRFGCKCAREPSCRQRTQRPALYLLRSGCAGNQEAGGAPPLMVSGAGHDAMVFAEVTKMGMLFVRCK